VSHVSAMHYHGLSEEPPPAVHLTTRIGGRGVSFATKKWRKKYCYFASHSDPLPRQNRLQARVRKREVVVHETKLMTSPVWASALKARVAPVGPVS
jgi:hypothetical protein